MNVSRLAEFSEKLVALEAALNIQKRLSRVSGRLQEVINQPQQVQHQTELVAGLAELRQRLGEMESELTPATVSFLDELRGRLYFSTMMADDIDHTVQTNSVTAAVAKSHVDELMSKRGKFIEALKSLSTNLGAVGLSAKPLEPGQAEIGFKIPRAMFENTLEGFSSELKFIELVVEIYSEAVTGQREEAQLSELSTSDPLVLLQLYSPIVVAIGGTISWLLLTYKQTLEIRELRARLQKLEVKDGVRELDEKVKCVIDAAVEKRVTQVLEKRKDEGREAELSNGLRIVMKGLFARIERGMTVEVRFLPPPEGEKSEKVSAEEKQAYADLAKIQKDLVFPAITEEPMFQLPKPEREAKKQTRKRGPKKKGEEEPTV